MSDQQTDADLIEIGAKAAHDIDPWPMDEDVSSWDQLPETEWIEINGVESIAPKQSYRLMAEAVIAAVRPIIEERARAEGRREGLDDIKGIEKDLYGVMEYHASAMNPGADPGRHEIHKYKAQATFDAIQVVTKYKCSLDTGAAADAKPYDGYTMAECDGCGKGVRSGDLHTVVSPRPPERDRYYCDECYDKRESFSS